MSARDAFRSAFDAAQKVLKIVEDVLADDEVVGDSSVAVLLTKALDDLGNCAVNAEKHLGVRSKRGLDFGRRATLLFKDKHARMRACVVTVVRMMGQAGPASKELKLEWFNAMELLLCALDVFSHGNPDWALASGWSSWLATTFVWIGRNKLWSFYADEFRTCFIDAMLIQFDNRFALAQLTLTQKRALIDALSVYRDASWLCGVLRGSL